MNLVVYGTRPEEIKLWPFTKHPYFEFCEVNQSKDLHQGLIIPDYRADEEGLHDLIKKRKWRRVVVQGDTRTAFRAALYAFEEKIPVVHVEAGLRTWDLKAPFPEEGYRRMIDEIASFHYCSTIESMQNLNQASVPLVVGQTSIDTLLHFAPKPTVTNKVIVTVHRNEANIDGIVYALQTLIEANPKLEFVIYAHPNQIGARLRKYLPTREPLPYREFVKELASCFMIMTDSGGLQEEAPSLNKPYIVLRDKTERPEGIDAGCGVLGGMEPMSIISSFNQVLKEYEHMAAVTNPFGDGKAVGRIVRDLDGGFDPQLV